MKTPKQLFEELFQCHTEELVDTYISNNIITFQQDNWYPLGGGYFGVMMPVISVKPCHLKDHTII